MMIKRLRNRILREIVQTPIIQIPSNSAYKSAIKSYAKSVPTLASNDFNLVNTLKSSGIFVTSLESLGIPSTPQILEAAKKIMPHIAEILPHDKNEYAVHATSAQIMEYPELFLWGAEERLLDIIENYIGLPVAYHGLYFRRDLANGIQVKSRLWHIDMEDRCMVKIIIHLNDVNEDGGPFQYIPKELTSRLCKSIRYNYGYIQDKTVESVIPKSSWKSCTGAAGTVIFVDTASLFHRGKIPVASDRFTLFFDYTSQQPKNPFYCKSSLPDEDLLNLRGRLSERQEDCMFWR